MGKGICKTNKCDVTMICDQETAPSLIDLHCDL